MPEPRPTGRRLRASALATAVLLALAAPPSMAADDTQLQRVKGTVQYQNPGAAPSTVIGKLTIPTDAAALTQAKSAALLTLADSSIVALGENTDVQVGEFTRGAAGPGSTIVLRNGTLRFDVRRPAGATANYHFSTPTTQIAVRGTIGLLSVLGGNTTVACVVCAADSVSVTVGTQTFTLLTGQILTVTAAGAAAIGVATGSVLGSFSAAGVSTSASTGAAAATAGVAGAGAATGATLGTAAIAAGAAGAVAAGISAANPAKTDQPSPNGTAAGSISLTGVVRPIPSPPLARPLPAPPPPSAGPPGRR
jgi:hypothetical protein